MNTETIQETPMRGGRVHSMMEKLEAKKETLSQGLPSQEIAGLPVKRVVPMDVHAMMDYSGSAMGVVAGMMAQSPEARSANFTLAAAGAGVSLLTDYRLSAAKVIPIEVHEAIDYVWGFSNVAAPFLFGYWKKEPVVSAMQIMNGAMTILGSLFTDYRSYTGKRWW